jgi:hypothetical protein
MRKKVVRVGLILLILTIIAAIPSVAAQEVESGIQLSISRDFGYSSGTGRIQGTFSMRIDGPDDLVRVVFMVDGVAIYEDGDTPFRYQFNTDAYTPTEHSLVAVGYTADGRELTSNEIRVTFVTAEEGSEAALRLIIPLLAVILGLMTFSYLIPMVMNRGKGKAVPLGQPRNYGLTGDTICPKCNRPFSMNFIAPNLLLGKLDRCPHCGKWSLVRRISLDKLRRAEAAELAEGEINKHDVELSEADKIKKALEDSRYQDL